MLAAYRCARRRQAIRGERRVRRVARSSIAGGRQVDLGAQDSGRFRQPVHLQSRSAKGHRQRAKHHFAHRRDVGSRGSIVLFKNIKFVNLNGMVFWVHGSKIGMLSFNFLDFIVPEMRFTPDRS